MVNLNLNVVLIVCGIVAQVLGSVVVLWRVSYMISRYVFRLEVVEKQLEVVVMPQMKAQQETLQSIKTDVAILVDRKKVEA